jgi:hypothetical protein
MKYTFQNNPELSVLLEGVLTHRIGLNAAATTINAQFPAEANAFFHEVVRLSQTTSNKMACEASNEASDLGD